jgi:hypothetical protein
MKTLPSCLCILGFATASLGGAGTVLLDNIGAADGSEVAGGYGGANQIFETANAAFDIGNLATFENPDASGVTSVEAVVSGFAGTAYAGPDGIEGWQVSFFSGTGTSGAYCTSLIGDIQSYTLLPSEVALIADFSANPTDPAMGAFLVTPNLGGGNALPSGTNTVGVMPLNPFATNGQMLMTQSLVTGAELAVVANPGDGFAGGACSTADFAVALRVFGGTPDPCGTALPEVCPADVSGPDDEPDGFVNVSDLLAVIANWNAVGDGTFRPVGDCRPLPNGDCQVNVSDLLGVIAEWNSDCIAKGACCFGDGSCTDDVAEADCSGQWLGNGSNCADNCLSGACCAPDGTCAIATADGCVSGTYAGDGTNCLDTICGQAPGNNDCADAFAAVDGSNDVDTNNATTTGPADFDVCDNFSVLDNFNDVYYTYTATCEGIVTVSLCDTVDFDSRIQIYSDCTFGNQLACNDDGEGCGGNTSLVTFNAILGEPYVIRIGGYADGGTGSGTFTISCEEFAPGACCLGTDLCQEVPSQLDCEGFGGTWQGNGSACADVDCDPTPANNLCADAEPMAPGSFPFSTTDATASEADPSDALCADTYLDWAASPDVWFSWTATEDGLLTLDTCDATSYDTSMVLYAGDCTTKVEEACNGDDGTGSFDGCQQYYSAIVNAPVTAGTSYLVRLGGWNGGTGSGILTVQFSSASAIGACCVNGNCVGDDITFGDCTNTLGGLWAQDGLCADIECPQPFAACDSGIGDELLLFGNNGYQCVCQTDGFDTEVEDCNGGVNQAVASYTEYIFGSSVCGEASVYVDGPTGGTYRDLDWWTCADLAAGGDFTLSVGSTQPKVVIIYNLDDDTNGGYQNAVGFTAVADLTVAAGNNVVLTGPSEWETTWTCGSGFTPYQFSVSNAAP